MKNTLDSNTQKTNKFNTYELTEQQKNIWNTEMFYSGTNMYNIGGYIFIDEKVDFSILEKAANLFIEKTEISRAHFVFENGIPKQYIKEFKSFKINVIDFNTMEELDKYTTDYVLIPMNIIDSDMYKFVMYRFKDGKGGIIPVFHHLINDAWGMGVFISGIMSIYQSLIDNSDCPYEYQEVSSYLANMSDYRNSSKYDKDKDYWNEVFSTEPELSFISSIKNVKKPTASRKVFYFDKGLYTNVENFAKENHSSVYSFFTGIYSLYLANINNTNSSIIGTPVLNRSNFKEKQMSGMFVSTVPLKLDINYDKTYKEFLSEINLTQMSVFRHQKYPYLDLLEEIKHKYNISENLYDFVFSYQNIRDNKKNLNVPYISTWHPTSNIAASIEVHFYDMDDTGNPSIIYNYQTEKFSEEDIINIHNRIINMAKLAINDAFLKDIPVITDKEKAFIDKFNETDCAYDKSKTIIDVFEDQVNAHSDDIAVVYNNSELTYKELDIQSNKLANFLINKGVKTTDVIGIRMNRGINIHVAIWGVLKAGASFILIDPSLPNDRVNYMLNNSYSPFIISDLFFDYEKYSLEDSKDCSDKLPNVNVSNYDRFCVIYTSGSTGTPKGVELKKLGIINLVNGFNNELMANNCNTFLSTSAVSFDMFLAENIIPILSGKKVVMANDREQTIPIHTVDLIKKYNIDYIISTPSKLSLILNEDGSSLKSIKAILLGGEVVKNSLVKDIQSNSKCAIINSYGPSECTCCTSNKIIINGEENTIGMPFRNVKVYIKNHIGNIMPIGVQGEMEVCGDNVGIGYLNKFKFNNTYKTGDNAYLSDKGELIYCGRQDNQIKFHGLRIELDEISKKLQLIPGISDSVCVIKKVNDIDNICAYITTTEKIETDRIKSELSKNLPMYMIPSHIIILDKMPLTLNGKIDTKNLPDVVVDKTEFVLPKTNTEKSILKIWQDVLGIEEISVKDNFFDLGGDSLASIRLVSEVYNKYKIKVDVKDVFDYPTIADFSAYIDKNDLKEYTVSLKPHKLLNSYPVSFAQRRIYYTCSMNEKSVSYNTPFGLLFDKKPDINKVEKIINTIINNHEAFRVYFELDNNDVVQKLVEKIDFKLEVLNHKNEDFVKPFDLSKAPLIHAELDIFDNQYLLQIDIHHIICDGVSISVFAKEFCDLYNGLEVTKSKIDYIDFALNETVNEKDKEFWLDVFKGEIPLLNMPTEYERGNLKSDVGDSIFDKLENVDKINNFCKQNGITPYMFLLAMYYIVLYKYTMQNDIVVGTPIVGREKHEFKDTIGMFVNTLALKQIIQSTYKTIDFINLVKETCLSAFSHQAFPFDELVRNLEIKRDNSRNPLFDTMFIYESDGIPDLVLEDNKVTLETPVSKTSKFDFSLEITPKENEFGIRLEFSTKLFGKKFMKSFLDYYKNIINLIIKDPNIQISKINVLKDVPTLFTKLDYPKDKLIVDLFEEQAKKTPDKVALIFGNEQYTYHELERKVNMLANTIKNSKVYNSISKQDVKVIGILMNRRAELIISMLAILKVGAAYVPIDPTYPSDRINDIIADSKVELILTEHNLNINIPNVNLLYVDEKESYSKYNSFKTLGNPNDPGYLLFTSGSTGKPKGVMVKQNGIVNFIYSMTSKMPLKGKKIVSITTMCFDIFVLESLLPVCSDMTIILANNDEQNNPVLLNNLCLKNNAEIIQTTPSKFKFLMSDKENLEYIKKMKIISLAGEPFSLDLYKSIQIVTNARVYNMYGPTETTVGSTLMELTPDISKVTIGKPIDNTEILILDNDLNPVPINVPGTLYIGGDGVSAGYINRPELTAERFITYNDHIVYNSGDLVKQLPNGELDCLGRTDFQVKVRGLRIELGEIEEQIKSYKDVTEAVVSVKTINNREVICGYFTANSRVSVSGLRNTISRKLPNYMIPSFFIQLEKFEYTPNGKIDRKKLPIPKIEKKEIRKPDTDLEFQLLRMWSNILSIEQISTDDNFFEIGGDSLCALKLQLELMKQNINVKYGDIFIHNTIKDLASFIEDSDKEITYPIYHNSDFKNINKVLKENSPHKKLKIKERVLKNTLLVGATGFLGIHVLAELLKDDTIKIFCLIREDPSTSPENKLKNKFMYYFGSDLSYLFGKRLFVINGDVTKPLLGLTTEQLDLLGSEISTVINCSSIVKHYGEYSLFEKVNIIGVKNLVDFCEKYNKEFIQSSTVSVSGNTITSLANSFNPNHKIKFGENKLFVNQSLENVYVRSKFEAEKFILEEIYARRLNGLILRIGNITNRFYDGKFQENDDENAFLNRLKAFMNLKMLPKSMLKNYIEFTPVDYLARAIIESIKTYTPSMSVLHLYNSKHLYINDLYDILQKLKINIKIVEDDKFKEILQKQLFDESTSFKVNVLLNDLDINNNLVYKTNLHITNKFTLKFLKAINFDWPEITIDYIKKILQNL